MLPQASARPASRRREKESADKPGSVEDNHSSAIRVAAYLKRPTREPVRATRAAQSEDLSRLLPYLVLLQAGFAVPPSVATGAVRSYRTLSPLPAPIAGGRLGGLLSVALSVGSRPPGVTWRLALGARTFLHACAQRLSGRLRRAMVEAARDKKTREQRNSAAADRARDLQSAVLSFSSSALPAPASRARSYSSLRLRPVMRAAIFAACDGDNSSQQRAQQRVRASSALRRARSSAPRRCTTITISPRDMSLSLLGAVRISSRERAAVRRFESLRQLAADRRAALRAEDRAHIAQHFREPMRRFVEDQRARLRARAARGARGAPRFSRAKSLRKRSDPSAGRRPTAPRSPRTGRESRRRRHRARARPRPDRSPDR